MVSETSPPPKTLAADSVGLVAPQTASFPQGLTLQCGETLAAFDLVYETYGALNSARSNAVLICHALSGSHHAAGFHARGDAKPGWWDACIGPGKPIDTNRFFVVSPNNLGGCDGSTGPCTTEPGNRRPVGRRIPHRDGEGLGEDASHAGRGLGNRPVREP